LLNDFLCFKFISLDHVTKGASETILYGLNEMPVKELEKEMKEIANDYKKAEGKEKETLLDKLKEKTKVKKELEALEDKLADAIV
jgi:hypothetical protein